MLTAMVPSRYRAFERTLTAPYDALHRRVSAYIPVERLITDPLRLLTWGTDASFYRLVPRIAVVVDSEDEVVRLLADCAALGTPVTFRAAGTSLSGQAITDSVLVLLGDGWRRAEVGPAAETITLQPGVIGADANRRLAGLRPQDRTRPRVDRRGDDRRHRRQQRERHVLRHRAEQLPHARGPARRAGRRHRARHARSREPRRVPRARSASRPRARRARQFDTTPTARSPTRIRHKFRIKNTTGYSLNALVDFEDPIDVLAHLMIGSEGTLGFISEITYATVADHADKASALILFDDLETACRAVALLKSAPVAAVELADRAALRSVEGKPGLPEGIGALGPDGAALLVETRAPDRATLGEQILAIETKLAVTAGGGRSSLLDRRRRMRAPLERAQGHVPFGGRDATRRHDRHHRGRRLPGAAPRRGDARLQRLLAEHGYADAIIFGHALEGNLHFVFTQDFNAAAEVERYRGFMDALCPDGRRTLRRLAQGRARHRPQHRAIRRARMGRGRLPDHADDQDALRSARAAESRGADTAVVTVRPLV